jgi:hypothetical protein
LRVIHNYGKSPLMMWRQTEAGWRPTICDTRRIPLDRSEINDAIAVWLEAQENGFTQFARHPERQSGKGTGIGVFGKMFGAHAASTIQKADVSGNRITLDMLSSLGNEMIVEREKGKDDGPLESTGFRATRSHEFIAFAANIEVDTTVDHVVKTIFAPWQYDDPIETHSLRLDPYEDSRSRYALRWDNPGDGNPERKKSGAMWGANRLAIEAFAFFPVAPVNGQLETTGFTQRKGTFWTWPIWEVPIGLEVIKSLLAHAELQKENPKRRNLYAIGVVEVFRSQRISKDKYRNFTPSSPV